jgi:hypothetical protein
MEASVDMLLGIQPGDDRDAGLRHAAHLMALQMPPHGAEKLILLAIDRPIWERCFGVLPLISNQDNY